MMALPSNRAEARAVGSRYYFTGEPCKYGHVDKRYTSSCICAECSRKYNRYLYRKYYEKHSIRIANYYRNNLDKKREYHRKYRLQNIEYYRSNSKRWAKANPARIREYNNIRRKGIKQATPIWVDKKEILKTYEQAIVLELRTGILHEVDHIVPINGRGVCGLHVPWNLRAIPMVENRRKSNSLQDGELSR